MRPANTVAVVFKVLVISVFLMAAISFGVSMFTIFTTQQKIDTVGNAMKTELSKNNVILYESLWTGDTTGGTPGPFLAQLSAIEETTRSNGNRTFVLTSIEICDYKDGAVDDASAITVLETKNTDFSEVPEYNFLQNKDAYYNTCTGDYGEFKVLRFNYAISYDVFLPPGASDDSARGVVDLEAHRYKFAQSFDYVVPCLRYMK